MVVWVVGWPAAFSFVGPLLLDGLGTPATFRLLAGAGLVLCVPPALLLRLPPEQRASTETVNTTLQTKAVISDQAHAETGSTMATANQDSATKGAIDAVPAAALGKLPRIELLKQRRFWLVAMGATCIMTPGFGIELLIGPQMYAVYQSSQDAESVASFMFLIAYSFMRLMTGVLADHFGIKPLFVIIGISQVSSLALLGVCVFNGWPQAWAMALYTVVGLSLAGSKVLLQVWCLHLWGAANCGVAFGMTSIGVGVAAILGPISAWWALCQVRMSGGIPVQGEQSELELAFAVWLWACSFLTAVGIICVVAVKASDQQAFASHSNDTIV